MLIDRLPPEARELLVTIKDGSPLIDAANQFRKGIDLVVVCDEGGRACGVVTKTDVVAKMSQCGGASCTEPASTVMTRNIVSCQASDWGTAVWASMKEHSLKNLPILDSESRPIGVMTARLVLQLLLEETSDEEALLRDYVMNVGYH